MHSLVGSEWIFTSEEDEEVYEVIIDGITAADPMNSFGFDVIIKDKNSSQRWQISPAELEVA